jgi:hypothetical protein
LIDGEGKPNIVNHISTPLESPIRLRFSIAPIPVWQLPVRESLERMNGVVCLCGRLSGRSVGPPGHKAKTAFGEGPIDRRGRLRPPGLVLWPISEPFGDLGLPAQFDGRFIVWAGIAEVLCAASLRPQSSQTVLIRAIPFHSASARSRPKRSDIDSSR